MHTAVSLNRYVLIAVIVGMQLVHASGASALNGPQFVGFSAESTALAGAGSVAVADTSAINTNPAALSLIQGTRFDVTAGPLKPILHHRDAFGNDTDGQNDLFVLGNAGFAKRMTQVPGLTIGAGIFTQGGFGTDYRNLATAFGTRDSTSTFFRYLKVAFALSYDVTDRLTVAVAPHVGYADVSLRLFPGTSAPPTFFGVDIRDRCARNAGLGGLGNSCPSDVVFGAKVGVMYKLAPWMTVGATYTSPVRFNFTGGQVALNESALGLGRVNYDARVAGIKWPQQVDVSMAARPVDRLLIALTTSWINWAAINTVEITATNSSLPAPLNQVNLNIPFNWKDQVVVAVGVAYAVMQDASWKEKDRLVVRAGYNYSNNPVPNETLSPLAPLILKHRVSGGVGFRFTERWSFDTAFIYSFKNTETYTNPSLPFGPNATESIAGYYVFNTVSYRF
jgi:long-chain fatty acid transport protein